jgi:hypothetical protein
MQRRAPVELWENYVQECDKRSETEQKNKEKRIKTKKRGTKIKEKDKRKARGMTGEKTGQERVYRMKYRAINLQKQQCGQVTSGIRRKVNRKLQTTTQ